MSDLISRSELIENFRKCYSGHLGMENSDACMTFHGICNVINNTNTAYDVDKVVEELKVIKEDALAEYNMGEYNLDNNIGNSIAENYRKDMNEGKCFAYDEAIEIVKQGSVADDVCEWRLTDTRKVMPYKTSCGNEDLYDNSYKYCPYCGKKIKVMNNG